MNDHELDQLLKTSSTPLFPPADFQHNVWSRIEAAELGGWKPRANQMLERLLGVFALPPVAVATCVAMVAVGTWFGLQARDTGATGRTAYIQSVSPFAHNHR